MATAKAWKVEQAGKKVVTLIKTGKNLQIFRMLLKSLFKQHFGNCSLGTQGVGDILESKV